MHSSRPIYSRSLGTARAEKFASKAALNVVQVDIAVALIRTLHGKMDDTGVSAYISANSVGSDHFRPRKLRPKGMPLEKTPSGTVVTGYLMSAPSTSVNSAEELT